LAYSFDHRAEIDRDIQEGEEFVKALLQKTPSRLPEKLRERLGHGD